MSSTVYYFSATGNSLHAAKCIASELEDCNIISMPSLVGKQEITSESHIIGLVFPLHAFGLPVAVANFIEKLKAAPGQYIFAVVTCGSPYFSCALQQVKSLLAAKGAALAAGFHVKMLSNYTPLADIPSPRKRQLLLERADKKLAAIAKRIKTGQHYNENEFGSSLYRLINSGWKKRVAGSDKKFSCNDQCTACGLCEKICPANNIVLKEGRPEWLHDCLGCVACLHICPAKSINFGKITAKRQRYRHPEITVAELLPPEKRDSVR